MTTLCIIDMQHEFEKPAKRCLDEVCRQIKLAKRRHAGIIVVEYENCGPTFSRIKALLKPYKRKTYKKKGYDGGGLEVLSAARRKGFSIDKIRFAGVNRSYCVSETIAEVIARHPGKIEIAIDATWCRNPREGRNKLRRIGKFV